jgi:DNA invertase Pin-like site-specific DNA recombinase
VSLRLCYLCGARVERRDGRRNLMEHRCLGGKVRAPMWPRVDTRIERMRAAGVPVATVALRLGLSRTAVYKNTPGGHR